MIDKRNETPDTTTTRRTAPDGGTGVALIVGATGGFGSEMARALAARGWCVRALHRAPHRVAVPRLPAAIEWRTGDAMSADDVARAADGAALVVHAANPPRYRHWRALALPMLDNAVAAAQRSGARLLLPGNIYNFGPDAWPVIADGAAQHPITHKGRVRAEMEARLAAASAADGLRVLILRAGDYFGPHAPAAWLTNALVKPGRPVRSVTWPGAPGIGHAFAYLPDLAEAAMRLIEAGDRLAAFETVNFAGHWVTGGPDFARAVAAAAGVPDLPVKRFPWPLLRLLSPVVPMFRELVEMRYLWREPIGLDNGRLAALIGSEPHTPLETALRESLAALGCLPGAYPTDAMPQSASV